MIRDLQTLAGGRIVCALEGGYRLKSTASGVAATLRALVRPDEPVLADAEPHFLDAKARLLIDQSSRQTINEVAKVHRAYWGVLHGREPAKQIACAGPPMADAPGPAADGGGRGIASAAPAAAAKLASPDAAAAAAAAADVCRSCGTLQPKAHYAKSQWKRSAAGLRTCAPCALEARSAG
jgi:hypothetical protein